MRCQLPSIAMALIAAVLLTACSAPAAPTAPPPPAKPGAAGAPPAPAINPAAAAPSAASGQVVPPLSPTVSAKAGLIGAVTDAAMLIAQEKGYFRDEGLDIEFVYMDSAARMIAPMATNELQIASGAPSAGLYNAITRGVPVKIVADKGTHAPGFGSTAFVVRKELVDSGQFKSEADLKGRRVALSATATSNHIDLDILLQSVGLALEDVELVTMGFPDMAAAFANGSVDAGFLSEPFVARGAQNGILVRWKGIDEIYPNHATAVIMYSPDFARTEAAKRFMVAYVRGARDYNDAFVKNRGRAEVVQILARTTNVKEVEVYDKIVPIGLNPDGYTDAASLIFDHNWYIQRGFVQEPVDMAQVIDHSFADYAVQRLGPYSRQ